jgi:LysM repeat protein
MWPVISLAVVVLAAVGGVLIALNGLSNVVTGPTATATSPVTSPALTPSAATEPAIAQPPTATAEPSATAPTMIVATDTPVLPAATATPEAPTPEPSPTPEPLSPTPEAKVITYTVVAGDSCYAIFQRFGIPVEDIIRINKLSANCFIQPGDVLIVSP